MNDFVFINTYYVQNGAALSFNVDFTSFPKREKGFMIIALAENVLRLLIRRGWLRYLELRARKRTDCLRNLKLAT